MLRVKKALRDPTHFSAVSVLKMSLTISKAHKEVNIDLVETLIYFQDYVKSNCWKCSATRAGTIEI